MCCFISGDWLRSILNPKKVKEDRSKKVKVHSDIEKSNGCKEISNSDAETGSTAANGEAGASRRNSFIHGMSAEHDKAALRIQTAFRAYMARKSLRRYKGSVRFNVLIQGHDTLKQASRALSCIHSWSNIQAQIRTRRHHMVTEGRIKQKKLENQLKLDAKLHDLEVEWCGGAETMEEILSRIQQREEAAVKRERAMAYAFSHQWRANPTQYLGQAYYSLGKENWGWSWKERWIAARPWEIRVSSQLIKKGYIKQLSKLEIKMPLAIRPASSNGKANVKVKKLASPTADHEAPDEAIANVSSPQSSIPC